MKNFLVKIRPELVLVYEFLVAFIGAELIWALSLIKDGKTIVLGAKLLSYGLIVSALMLIILIVFSKNIKERFANVFLIFIYGILGSFVFDGFKDYVLLDKISGLFDIILYGGAFLISLILKFRKRSIP